MNAQRVVYMNGEFVPEAEAHVSIYDSALMFGDMVFEMTRSFAGRQFKLHDHLERLLTGIKILRIPLELGIDELEEICLETVHRNEPAFAADDEHRLMLNVSRGPLSIYAQVFGEQHPGCTVVVADFPLRWTVQGMGALFEKGINAVIPSQRAIPSTLLDAKIKNRSRLHYQMANIEVAQYSGENNWALLLDPDGFIAEGTGDNFFVVKDGQLATPEGRNILRGVSRGYVMELAAGLDLGVRERNLEAYDAHAADEAFMTGTPFCILPVTRLNGLPIGDGAVGPVTARLLAAWSETVGVDIVAQIKAWDAAGAAGGAQGPSPYSFQ